MSFPLIVHYCERWRRRIPDLSSELLYGSRFGPFALVHNMDSSLSIALPKSLSGRCLVDYAKPAGVVGIASSWNKFKCGSGMHWSRLQSDILARSRT